ncbi:hypothetical protein HanIR_Chr09g0450671 [Helianthus annuus]|nr:hypothetical protein HanIR_Chr09g0450671 [Helianthus annuus]
MNMRRGVVEVEFEVEVRGREYSVVMVWVDRSMLCYGNAISILKSYPDQLNIIPYHTIHNN